MSAHVSVLRTLIIFLRRNTLCRTIEGLCWKAIRIHASGIGSKHTLIRNSIFDVLADNVGQEPGPMKIADDVVLCGGDEDGVTGYLWSCRRALVERGVGVSIYNGWKV